MRTPLIVGPVVPKNFEGAVTDAVTAARKTDIVEIRFDTLAKIPSDAELLALRCRVKKPLIATVRARCEGGRWRYSERSRIDLIVRAGRVGFDFVDCEYFALGGLPADLGGAKLIASFHDFSRVPARITQIAGKIERSRADIVKLSCMANDIADNFRMFGILRGARKPTVALCMGERGVVSRIWGPAFGLYFTFAAVTERSISAPGQVMVDELKKCYRFRDVSAATKIFGVAANPVAHSASPAVHNAALAAANIDGLYLPFLVDDMEKFMSTAATFGVRGLSVTVPHKEAALKFSRRADRGSREIGSANTLTLERGGYRAYNTDLHAAIIPLSGRTPLKGENALVLGAGGVARAITLGLKRAGAHVAIHNRTPARARSLARELGVEYVERLADCTAFRVVANATSVGMWPHEDRTPFPARMFRSGQVAFDAVYVPRMTRFLREAKRAGCAIVDGVEMFVAQAGEQFRIFTGRPAPVGVMERALLDFLRQKH